MAVATTEDIAAMRARLVEAWQRIDASALGLSEKLAAYDFELRNVSPELRAAYDRMVQRFSGNGAAELAPAVGDIMPDFLFPDSDGHLVELSSLWRAGPLVVTFNRGHWCPFCRLELRALARAVPQIETAGGRIVSLVPETQGYARQMIATSSLPFPVLIDLDLSYALLNGLVISIGDEVRDAYLARGLDVARFQGNNAWLLPIPATFVVAASGRVIARFIDPDFRLRMPIDNIIAAIELAGRQEK